MFRPLSLQAKHPLALRSCDSATNQVWLPIEHPHRNLPARVGRTQQCPSSRSRVIKTPAENSFARSRGKGVSAAAIHRSLSSRRVSVGKMAFSFAPFGLQCAVYTLPGKTTRKTIVETAVLASFQLLRCSHYLYKDSLYSWSSLATKVQPHICATFTTALVSCPSLRKCG